jgi:signal transduction histidine kinase
VIGDHPVSADAYARVLEEYLRAGGEAPLERASLLSRSLIEDGFGPEEVVVLHTEAVAGTLGRYAYSERERVAADAFQFLLQVMVTYGAQYREHLELKLGERARAAEARVVLEREKASDAERSDREKADVLAIIAHELRTPITAALGNVDYATRLLEQGKTDLLPGVLHAARDALRRLARLASDLVEASRGDTTDLEVSPQDLGALLAQACAWAGVAAEAKGVSLVCDAETGGRPVPANADALLTVFGNLLSNAIRYTPAGGRVEVRRGGDGDWARVEVRDTGIGMPPEVQGRIFDRFYRAPDARRLEAQGLGLGLSLANRLLLAHGGRLEVESAPGRGSTFRVLLPVMDSEASTDRPS